MSLEGLVDSVIDIVAPPFILVIYSDLLPEGRLLIGREHKFFIEQQIVKTLLLPPRSVR